MPVQPQLPATHLAANLTLANHEFRVIRKTTIYLEFITHILICIKIWLYAILNTMTKIHFEWDENKADENCEKHGVSFYQAQKAFLDSKRVIAEDVEHSQLEQRYYCFGKVDSAIITVRFTYRGSVIRIIGAGYWRKGKKIYEQARN
jgi:uncharacterized DUF497 family protein